MSYRNPEPFFHDPEVLKAVGEAVDGSNLVIYVGSGATVDRTGMDWKKLISSLLSNRSLLTNQSMSDEEAALMSRTLTPVEGGSLAEHLYRKRFPAKYQGSLDAALRSALYSGDTWRAGKLTTNIIRLAVAMVETNKHVHIATTNYDTFLEDEFEEQAKLLTPEDGPLTSFPHMHVDVLGDHERVIAPSEESSGTIRLTYLHGRIPFVGEREGVAALTELDYFNIRERVHNTLRALFQDSPVLILGSSLTDPPLLAALQATAGEKPKKGDDARPRRFALTPMMAYKFDDLSADEVSFVKKNLANRMRQFRVELLFPDFFFQIAQFCEEAISALKKGKNDGESYTTSSHGIRYSQRLESWWGNWEPTHTSADDVEVCYLELKSVLDHVKNDPEPLCPPRDNVEDSHNELFKLEVWVRWKPSRKSRRLALWAVSTGIRRDFESIRTAELDAGSEYESVQAFIAGAPRLEALRGSQVAERWKTFLSVPIYALSELGDLPVAVVSLAGSRSIEESRVAVDEVDAMQELVLALARCGRRLVNLAGPESDSAEPVADLADL